MLGDKYGSLCELLMLFADVPMDPILFAITSALRVFDRASESYLAPPAFLLYTLPYGKNGRIELSCLKIIGVGVRRRLELSVEFDVQNKVLSIRVQRPE